MIKGVVFDMDGVLIDAREWHYLALNQALNIFGFNIDISDHEKRFNGLPTRVKLDTLTDEKGLPKELHSMINEIKQERTLRIAASSCYPLPNVISAVSSLSLLGLKLGVATNSIRVTTEAMLNYSKLIGYFDAIVTNEDVKHAKPSPDIYLEASRRIGLKPQEVLVIEDNENGIRAALDAGCTVHEVSNPFEVHLDEILKYL
jgi:HAD superfamily hydrolase (TIGR01509 family)